jgi:hypothetical protein
MRFEIDSPQAAFDALHSLCCEHSRQELLSWAELDGDGWIHSVQVPWSREKGGENPLGEVTVLGNIHIEGTVLTAEVNSLPREERLRREIESRLGSGARYQGTEISTQEEMLQQMRESPARDSGQEAEWDPMSSPEVREAVAEKIRAHWREWIDTQIPALGGITPREAVRDPDGRESVEALLSQGEGSSPGNGLHEAQKEGIRLVRRELGIDDNESRE